MRVGRTGLVDSAELEDARHLLPTSLRIQLYFQHGDQPFFRILFNFMNIIYDYGNFSNGHSFPRVVVILKVIV